MALNARCCGAYSGKRGRTPVFLPQGGLRWAQPAKTRFGLNMPELRAYYGYPAALALMALVVVVLLIVFRRKRWL